MKRPDELFRTYPNAVNAIAYCELFVMSEMDGEESAFAIIMRTKLNPREVVQLLRDTVTDENDPITSIPADVLVAVVSEMRHSDFLNYVAGKMGAM